MSITSGQPRPVGGIFGSARLVQSRDEDAVDCFLAADDVDKALEVIAAHGGPVVRGAEDTPYGRLAAVTDPTGAGFNLSSVS
jgi:uncharacterized protein